MNNRRLRYHWKLSSPHFVTPRCGSSRNGANEAVLCSTQGPRLLPPWVAALLGSIRASGRFQTMPPTLDYQLRVRSLVFIRVSSPERLFFKLLALHTLRTMRLRAILVTRRTEILTVLEGGFEPLHTLGDVRYGWCGRPHRYICWCWVWMIVCALFASLHE
jgi:hypothetical protein